MEIKYDPIAKQVGEIITRLAVKDVKFKGGHDFNRVYEEFYELLTKIESLTTTKEPRVSAKEWILKTHGHCDDKDKMNLTFEELCEELESFFATQVERVSTEEIKKRAKEYADKHFRSDVSEKDNWDCEITFIDGFKEGLSSKQGEKSNSSNNSSSWISVEDRLPEGGKWYVVHTNRDCTRTGYCYHKANEWYVNDEKVTHWQPLPDAPEKEKEGN